MSCAFAHCKHLRTLQLPGKLRKIQQEAFLKCTSLTEVHVPLRCSILQEEHLEGARSSIDLSERTKA